MAHPTIGTLNPQTEKIIMNNCRPMVKVHNTIAMLMHYFILYCLNAHYSQFSCHVQLHTFFFSKHKNFRDTQMLHYSNIGVLTKFTYFYCNMKHGFSDRYQRLLPSPNSLVGEIIVSREIVKGFIYKVKLYDTKIID